jgi:anion-transporting  ArsA/GET3 family ATPase
VSAATGIKAQAAEKGLRTIIMSLDVAHSLADIFDLETDLLDCAPTGESLRFISIPTTLEWYMKKLFEMEHRLAKYVFPVAKHIVDVPLPDDDYFQAIENLFERLKGVDQVLMDPKVTTVRLVTNKESRNAFF